MSTLIKTIQTDDEKDRCLIDHQLAYILDTFVFMSFHYKSCGEIKKLISEFSEATRLLRQTTGHFYLIDAVLTHLFWTSQSMCKRSEKELEEHFYDNLDEYLKGAIKIDRVDLDRKNMPDGFVMYKGTVMPVEIKMEAVTKATIAQIQRYIDCYNSVGGFVVAPELRVDYSDMPDNVTYIKVTYDNIK